MCLPIKIKSRMPSFDRDDFSQQEPELRLEEMFIYSILDNNERPALAPIDKKRRVEEGDSTQLAYKTAVAGKSFFQKSSKKRDASNVSDSMNEEKNHVNRKKSKTVKNSLKIKINFTTGNASMTESERQKKHSIKLNTQYSEILHIISEIQPDIALVIDPKKFKATSAKLRRIFTESYSIIMKDQLIQKKGIDEEKAKKKIEDELNEYIKKEEESNKLMKPMSSKARKKREYNKKISRRKLLCRALDLVASKNNSTKKVKSKDKNKDLDIVVPLKNALLQIRKQKTEKMAEDSLLQLPNLQQFDPEEIRTINFLHQLSKISRK